MKFNPSKNLSDQIADYLIERIINLGIVPGERILEQKLAKELGVSRSPVREALRVLEQTGLVELIPRCGARVTAITAQQVQSYCDMFTLLLGHVARQCIDRCNEDHVNALTRKYHDMEFFAEKGDHKGFYNALLDCLSVGIEATGNPAIGQVIKSIMPYLKRLQYIAILLKLDSLADSFNYLRPILDALYERNAEKGGKAMEAYIENEVLITLAIVNNSELSKFISDNKE